MMHLAYHLALLDLSVDARYAVSAEDKPRDGRPLRTVNVVKLEQAGLLHLPAVVPVEATVGAAAFEFNGVHVSNVPVDDRLVELSYPLLIHERPVAHVLVVALPI